jgi:hypothetical protein
MKKTAPPSGSWLITLGRDKIPERSFGGWTGDGPKPSGRQADWAHDETYELSDNEEAHRLRGKLEEADRQALLLDIDGANLLVADYDLVDEGEEADPEAGKWGDEEELHEHVVDVWGDDVTIWHSRSGGRHVPMLLTDEAYESVFNNEWGPGVGVDAWKGPADKGYVASPLSPGYGVAQSGGSWPLLGLEDLQDMEQFDDQRPDPSEAAREMRGSEPGDWEPRLSRDQAHSIDRTDDVTEIIEAINHLRPPDFDPPVDFVRDRGDGTMLFDPSPYRATGSGESLAFLDDGRGVWFDLREGRGFYSEKLVALCMGLIDRPGQRLDGGDWWAAVDRLRELGAPVPEWSGRSGDYEVLEGLGGEGLGGGDGTLLWEIRRQTEEQLRACVREGVDGHFVAPKAAGKTYGAVRVAEERRVSIFAPTKQKYDEIIDECEEAGLSVLRLPSFPEHSPLYDDWESEYHRGAFPREIYQWEDRDTGTDEYKDRQDEDFDDYDILVGATDHAFIDSVTEGRVCIFDDSELGGFRERLDDRVKSDIRRTLEAVGSEHESHRGLLSADWAEVEAEMVDHLEGTDAAGADDLEAALERATGRADDHVDRRKFLARVPGADLGTIDWMRALCGDLHESDDYDDRGTRLLGVGGEYVLVRAPVMGGAEQVLTMGAWPARDELEQAFEDMGVEYGGMYGVARHGDMERALGRYVCQTSEHVHNKSAGRENPVRVEALRAAVGREGRAHPDLEEEEVQVFTTKAEAEAIAESRGSDLGSEPALANYGSLVGSNAYSGNHLGVVGASQHFGEDDVRLRAAYSGEAPLEPADDGPYTPRRWAEGTAHARIERRMRQGGLYEAVTRLGRDDTSPTVIYADTCELPDWLRTKDMSDAVRALTDCQRALYRYVEREGEATISQGGAEEALDYSRVALHDAAGELVEAGLLERCDEDGAYGSFRYEVDQPVSQDPIGLQTTELTGEGFSEPTNPQWDVQTLEADGVTLLGEGQTALDSAGWAG